MLRAKDRPLGWGNGRGRGASAKEDMEIFSSGSFRGREQRMGLSIQSLLPTNQYVDRERRFSPVSI